MWTAPDGIQHSALPQRWRHAGRVIEIAGSPAMAKRLGWAETTPAVSIATLRAAALARYRAEAGEVLRASLPSPWDMLRAVATAEYQAWADDLCAAVAEELARIEAAVEAADAEALAAIVADWPEVAE